MNRPAPPPAPWSAPTRLLRVLAAVALVVGFAQANAAPTADALASRYSLSGHATARNHSADHRFAGSGEAHYTPAMTSNNGRFNLKSTRTVDVGCDAFPVPIFADGFES